MKSFEYLNILYGKEIINEQENRLQCDIYLDETCYSNGLDQDVLCTVKLGNTKEI